MTYKISPLFAIPLYQSTVTIDPDMFKKLISFEYETYNQSTTHRETANRFILHLPEFAKLKQEVDSKISEFVHDAIGVDKTLSWDITTSWVNLAKKGDWHANHWHSNSILSGVIYLSTNDSSGAVLFHKAANYNNVFLDTFRFDYDKQTDYSAEAVGFLPKTSDILIFPSHLAHSVLENESTQDRYSLAFNVFPRGIFGQGGNSELTV